MPRIATILLTIYLLPAVADSSAAAKLVLPQQRNAFYFDEPIELAVAALEKGTLATVEITSTQFETSPLSIPVQGDGSTSTFIVPPYSLAPGEYKISLDGTAAAKLTIASGVLDSTFLISQTIGHDQLKQAGANYILGNAFSFGRFAPDRTGPLTENLRASRSPGLNVFEQAVAAGMPTMCYIYWTGYVTHKPFGSKKSWGAAAMTDAMRLLSFHTAQRLRRYEKNIISIGTIDKPGLGWGKTPAGGTASGFPDWDETQWYESRGWQFTNDPASRPNDDWMKYMTIRCEIMKEQMAQAKQDLKTVRPDMTFSTDLYAPHAVMDGTDPLAQQVNDIPASHVFVDWGIDRLGTYSGVYLEKAHDPTSKLAHAANGQLHSPRVPQPQQSYAYRAALNGMLAAGVASNWWLNTGGMSPHDLQKINSPAKRFGPLLLECTPNEHDVAVLWSFTEIAMREKEISAKAAHQKTGEPIKLMIAALPENTAIDEKEININAYNIGGDYKESVLTAHYACSRAGYPAHIVHERTLPDRILKNYRVLVIPGQTFALPPAVMQAIDEFTKAGGKIIVDQSTAVSLDGEIRADLNLKGLSYRWSSLFLQDAKSFKTAKEASYFKTNHFMDEPVRQAVAPLKAALQKTQARAAATTDSNELLIERHTAGEGALYMIANGYEELPDIADDEAYHIYNYAPQTAKFRLGNLPSESCVAYMIESPNWAGVSKPDPRGEIDGSFGPADMKLVLVAPRAPKGIKLTADATPQGLRVEARLDGLKMPWPLVVAVSDHKGSTIYSVLRSTGVDGRYAETFPTGCSVSIYSRLDGSSTAATAQPRPTVKKVTFVDQPVRVFDAATIKSFLAGKPEVSIALGDASHRAAAEKLATALSGKGIQATIKPEAEVLRKVAYPRVWNPYAKIYRAADQQPALDVKSIERHVTLSTDAAGKITAIDGAGNEVADWRQPKTLVTVAGEGLVDWIADDETCFEPGVKIYVDDARRLAVPGGKATEVRTTDEFRQRWAKPWTHLTTHVGGYQFPPQMPEAYTADEHLILLGDSKSSLAVAVLQATDLLLQVADKDYPGPGKALVSFAWSPFAVEKNVIVIAATDNIGLQAGVERLFGLVH